MSGVESVRPAGGNVLDSWDDMMRPFDLEKDAGDNQTEGSAVEENDGNDEAISVEEEEGAVVKIGKSKKSTIKGGGGNAYGQSYSIQVMVQSLCEGEIAWQSTSEEKRARGGNQGANCVS